MKKAVVLLSGGMDSAVTLYIARKDYECYALIFDYGQKAEKELDCARLIAAQGAFGYRELKISLPWKGSALLDDEVDIPQDDNMDIKKIPSTYVPARNLIFLSFGISYAEAIEAEALFIGANQLDYSNYPDCRDVFYQSFKDTVDKGTKSGVEGTGILIKTPIINLAKKDIVSAGVELGVPLQYTWSCYTNDDKPCGKCESCILRAKGFEAAGELDTLLQQ